MSRPTSLLRTTALAAILVTTSLMAAAQAPAPLPPSAAAATSQTDQRADRQQRMEQHRARMAERHQQRMEQLKTRLQLSPEQEPAWRAFQARMTPPQRQDYGQRGERPDFAAMSTPQRIERMKAWQAQRQTAQEQRMDATLAFYQALNPSQQRVFDQDTVPGFMRAGVQPHHYHGPGHERGWDRPGAEKGPRS